MSKTQSHSIKAIHLAKLRELRAEFVILAKDNERKRKLREQAYLNEASWEMATMGVKALRGPRR
jgi:hypothetical protein